MARFRVPDEDVQTVFLSKVFYYSVGRNAWWGAWSATYPGDHAFSLSREELTERIEEHRVQGSVFTLKELPALALMGITYDFLLFQTQGAAPFDGIRKEAISGKTMFEVSETICNEEPRLSIFLAPRGQSRLPVLPFRIYRSRALGPNRPLDWEPQDQRYDLAPVMRLVADVTMHLNDSR